MKKQEVVIMVEPGKKELVVNFDKTGSEEEVLALIIADQPGDYYLKILVDHKVGNTFGRGMVRGGAKSKVVCDALILDSRGRSDTYPTNIILENDVSLEHEATVSKVGEEQLFYLMSRGLSEHEAEAMIVNGFLEPVMKQIPLEYAVEMNRLVELEMEGSVG